MIKIKEFYGKRKLSSPLNYWGNTAGREHFWQLNRMGQSLGVIPTYLPFGLQGKYVGMTPNGEMYFRKETYLKDFSISSNSNQHFFIHEMVHVWQQQHGMWVKTRGLFSWASSYKYNLDENKKLNDYGMEQQAQIIADYFLLKTYGVRGLKNEIGRMAGFQGTLDSSTMPLYRKILPPSIL